MGYQVGKMETDRARLKTLNTTESQRNLRKDLSSLTVNIVSADVPEPSGDENENRKQIGQYEVVDLVICTVMGYKVGKMEFDMTRLEALNTTESQRNLKKDLSSLTVHIVSADVPEPSGDENENWKQIGQ